MAGRKGLARSRVIGFIVGALLVGAGVLGVIFLSKPAPPEEGPPPVRPLKTVVVGRETVQPPRRYPGRVRANQRVMMGFQVPGRLVELPVKRGDVVSRGQLLAKLDPRDYQSKYDQAASRFRSRQLDVERYDKAYKKRVATKKELDDAMAIRDTAKAEMEIAAKALEDTELHAHFAGVVADRFVENFQEVAAKEDVLSLQEIEHVEVVVSIPERRVARLRESGVQPDLQAVFDFAPDKSYPVTIKEYATEADPATQTFAVTVVMPAPKDIRIWPGMTATIVERSRTPDGAGGYRLPLAAVPVDETGQYYVWKVAPAVGKPGVYTTRRENVTVGPVMEADVLVTAGVRRGERVAAAGVHFLAEGQEVTLYTSPGETPGGPTSAPADAATTSPAGVAGGGDSATRDEGRS